MTAREKPRRPKQSTGQLMFNTHDPLAEIHRAGRAQEDDHFRKRDQELLMELRAQSAAESEQAIRHYAHMRCPKCGEPFEDTPARGARWLPVLGVARYGWTKGHGKGVWGRKHTVGSNGFSQD
jgi:hypothetical protein